MHRAKFLLAILAILTIALVVPGSISKGHADDASETMTTSGYTVRHTYDSFYGQSVDAVQAGNALTFTLVFVASNSGNFQRNITMGVRMDWMNNFENTTSSTPVAMGQTAYVSLSYTIPALTGQYANLNLVTHSWTVEVWDMAIGAVWTNSCNFYDTGFQSCRTFNNSFSYPLAVYSSAQSTGILTAQNAAAEISAMASVLGNIQQAPPGTSSAIAYLAAAQEWLNMGNVAYQTGNFATAQTDYQNALNNANSAQSSLQTTGGGTDTATLGSIWMTAVAGLLGGIGAAFLGFGGFNYLRHKSRGLAGSSPSSSYTPSQVSK